MNRPHSDSDTSYSGSEEEAPEIPIYGKSKKGKEILSFGGNEFCHWNAGRRLHNAESQPCKSAIVVPLRQLKNAIKEKAGTSMEKPSQIFNSMLSGVPEALQARLDKSASRKLVQGKRSE
uniref:Uncharacterized protein n=1 Tax=Ditylenchus dipsaci TaxID=166011 RepID=A0A915DYY3_9BILA